MNGFAALAFLALIFSAVNGFADWGLPNPPSTAIGESGTLYLAEPGWFFDIHNNDWLGQTDKLLTFSSALSYFLPLQTKDNSHDPTPEAFKFSVGYRLLTPVLETRFDMEELIPPEGIFAEWVELQWAYSRLFGRFKLELAVACDFFGYFNGDGVYHWFHEVVGSHDRWQEFGKRYEGTFGSGTVGVGYVWSENLLSMLYYSQSEIMESYTVATSLVYPINEHLSVAGENRFVQQLNSQAYRDERPFRHEWAWGLRWHFWQIHFKYVSPYLERDRWGQYYVSPVILNWKF